jgi:hypothetical protein
MRGANRMPFVAAMAAALAGARSGVDLLRDVMTPTVKLPAFGQVLTKDGKHRNSGSGSPRRRYGNNAGRNTAHCGHKQCRKYAAQKPGGDSREYDKRMAWIERNAHVMARRADDQLRARSDEGGRNAIIWGRR